MEVLKQEIALLTERIKKNEEYLSALVKTKNYLSCKTQKRISKEDGIDRICNALKNHGELTGAEIVIKADIPQGSIQYYLTQGKMLDLFIQDRITKLWSIIIKTGVTNHE